MPGDVLTRSEDTDIQREEEAAVSPKRARGERSTPPMFAPSIVTKAPPNCGALPTKTSPKKGAPRAIVREIDERSGASNENALESVSRRMAQSSTTTSSPTPPPSGAVMYREVSDDHSVIADIPTIPTSVVVGENDAVPKLAPASVREYPPDVPPLEVAMEDALGASNVNAATSEEVDPAMVKTAETPWHMPAGVRHRTAESAVHSECLHLVGFSFATPE
mmetsp:Transcript_37264/g.88150  ORF Transcript_37264/g.88150 Transcript_37264/m.88150 type:complete len:220 (-) Transcript_37264:6152-6811(-)